MGPDDLFIGLDVGSTTVKAVVRHPRTEAILWSDYQRHETRQAGKVLEFLEEIERRFPDRSAETFRIFVTGSGGGALAPHLGGKFVQEVNAVSLAVEAFHPDAGSVIELGGQDAKIIIWTEAPGSNGGTGPRRKFPSMNDKCAGGTGAVIDKIQAKLGLPSELLRDLPYEGIRTHPVAGKCGVFAETDITGLQKEGVPPDELMVSLFDAIVQQNLSVLTRGNTLRPSVLLLGGPNTFLPALRQAWKVHIARIWRERNTPLPSDVPPEDLVLAPDGAQYYAALGAVLYGRGEAPDVGRYRGPASLRDLIGGGLRETGQGAGMRGLAESPAALERFRRSYARTPIVSPVFPRGERVAAVVGIDGGSTSTKGVLLDRKGRLLARAYRLSRGNPIEDTREVFRELREQTESGGAVLEVIGCGVTGYAKEMLREALNADAALVETVAHTRSALHYFGDADVIVDVGGQDIKVIFLKNGRVRDFKLNTQCSAGNGYFLQSTALRFGFPVTEYADRAFSAERLPLFSYGCAVFMESDIVNFQQQGWSREEILAGLAHVLPKNIWLYVVQEPNLRKLGRRFILQGGTQHNLAAVKAQVDFIRERAPDAEVAVHPFTGEAGAIGAALEALAIPEGGTRFIGLEGVERLSYTTSRDESTRCHFCKNHCLRTFIDLSAAEAAPAKRYIIATCDKGAVERVEDAREIKKRMDRIRKEFPDFAAMAAREAFAGYPPVAGGGAAGKGRNLFPVFARRGGRDPRFPLIGIPRVLNFYSVAPFFIGYFQAIGIPYRNLVFSDFTHEAMYKEGARRGAIDACFPSKAALAHVHQLLSTIQETREKREGTEGLGPGPDLIFFPLLLSLPTELAHTLDSAACPTVAATPEVVEAAFTKEGDLFARAGIRYADPALNMGEPALLARQMAAFAGSLPGARRRENDRGMAAGYAALERFHYRLRSAARTVLDGLEREGRLGVVLLGRPYHNDPGLNHEILEEIRKLGYPIFTVESLPVDRDILQRLFGEEIARGELRHPLEITDVWKNAYSENTSRKLWAAKYVARHPNLAALDLSNFKCGHDAPVYSVIEEILAAARTPHFTFHDLDENRPAGSIRIRVETIHYFLREYEADHFRKSNRQERRDAMTHAAV